MTTIPTGGAHKEVAAPAIKQQEDIIVKNEVNLKFLFCLFILPVVSMRIIFGDFSKEECDDHFLYNGVQNVGVEFLCDTFNATKCWVEEGSKHTFSYLDNLASDLKNTFVDVKAAGVSSVESPAQLSSVESQEIPAKLQPLAEETKPLKTQENDVGSDVDTSAVKVSSWASLFKASDSVSIDPKNGVSEAPGIASIQLEQEKESLKQETKSKNFISLIDISSDHQALSLAEHVSHLSPNYSRHHLQLRGLVNRGNWCYINTTLQALLGIPAITHFYKALKLFSKPNMKTTSTPLTDSMILFFNQFEIIKIQSKKQVEDLRTGNAFEPRWVYDVLPVMKTTLSEKGRQEDAEEFLSFLLNGIHEELLELQKLVTAKKSNGTISDNNGEEHVNVEGKESDEESWEHVGKKNKGSILRKAVIKESLIKHVFGGVIRSSVHQTGKKESTTLQPFFTLQLDIQSDQVGTLNEALESYFMKENLHGFTCTTTNAEVEASRRTMIEELPLVLIFHLKYFVFDRKGGCQKIHKALEIPVDLEISKDILSSNLKNKSPSNSRNYKLCAVVYHHGKNAAGGHYTAAVHHGNPFGWVHFDDNNLKALHVNQVVKHQQGCVPYLLFYEQVQAR